LNGLTKVFVVLVTFLSVVLVALIVPFVANTENYRQSLQNQKTALAAAEQTASLKQNEVEASAARSAEEISKLKSEVAQFTSRNTSITSDLARAENDALTQRADNASLKAQISVLAATSKQYADITNALQTELSQRRTETLDLQTKLIELSRRNNDLEEQNNALTRNVRYSQEQMASLEEENHKYDQMLQKLPADQRQLLTGQNGEATGANQPFVPSTQIQGKITTVEKRLDDTFVQINIGSRDGVEPNMKFWVHRGDKFIGTLVITKVDTNASAGRMQLIQTPVTDGDLVLTGGF
jgi:chromosome segregation ATPase